MSAESWHPVGGEMAVVKRSALLYFLVNDEVSAREFRAVAHGRGQVVDAAGEQHHVLARLHGRREEELDLALPEDRVGDLQSARGAEPALAFNVGSSLIRTEAYSHSINVAAGVLAQLPFSVRLKKSKWASR